MENSVTILSNAGLGMAMFSLGRSIIVIINFVSLIFFYCLVFNHVN